MDRVDRRTRSKVMASVRSANTKPELLLRRALSNAGVRGWRVSPREVPGHPDVTFSRWKLAVFVDGCFWHGCPRCYRRPKSSSDYWDAKLARNRRRDSMVNGTLVAEGWIVLRLWEHEVRENAVGCASRVVAAIGRIKIVRT
ncbi:MAG: very short patch repair endonuclease [bacterium]